jgi:hypothetical protein
MAQFMGGKANVVYPDQYKTADFQVPPWVKA